MNETIPNSFRADINTVFKMIAVLKHVDEFKKMCKARYNTNKHDWCSCGLRELCQIRLTEILGHKSKANVYLFSLHAHFSHLLCISNFIPVLFRSIFSIRTFAKLLITFF